MADLTPRQARFVSEYIIDLNASQAAIRAGYSAKTAEQQGYRLLRNASVRGAIDLAKIQRRERVKLDADSLLVELDDVRRIAYEAIKRDREDDGPAPALLNSYRNLAELCGRHCGILAWREKIEIENTGPGLDEILEEAHQRNEAAALERKQNLKGPPNTAE